MTPRIRLARLIVVRTLEQAGVACSVPEVEEGVIENAPAWVDGGVEGVHLLERGQPVATVILAPGQPREAEVSIRLDALGSAPADLGRDLVADVAIARRLLTDLGWPAVEPEEAA